jgi:catechol 2,3-dioxygenase-like lactoylglutathione lyase family enzyme
MTIHSIINGAHAIIYSQKPDEDRAFLRDILGLPHVDAGDGWLILSLPPAELAVHPAEENDRHELYFMCADIQAFVTAMGEKGVPCDPVHSLAWGELTYITLPGGGKLGVYQPHHARAQQSSRRARPG